MRNPENQQQNSLKEAIFAFVKEHINWGGIALYVAFFKLPEVRKRMEALNDTDAGERLFTELQTHLEEAYVENQRGKPDQGSLQELKSEFRLELLEILFKKVKEREETISVLEGVIDDMGVKIDDTLPDLRQIVGGMQA